MTDNRKYTGKPGSGRPASGGEPRLWRPAKAIGLARALFKAGYATRRQAEEMVREGRVRIGDTVTTDPYCTADAGVDIFLDNQQLQQIAMRYYALHKPLRVVCDDSDGAGRKLIQDYWPDDIPGLAPAGRMDGKTTGLILVSNDSVWNTMITSTQGLEQEYRIQVEGELTDLEINVMTAGVHLPKLGLFRPENVRIVEVMNGHTVIHMTVREGKIRQVRRMLSTLRHDVMMVRRMRIGDIRLADLSVGAHRELSRPEIMSIREIHASVNRKTRSRGG